MRSFLKVYTFTSFSLYLLFSYERANFLFQFGDDDDRLSAEKALLM